MSIRPPIAAMLLLLSLFALLFPLTSITPAQHPTTVPSASDTAIITKLVASLRGTDISREERLTLIRRVGVAPASELSVKVLIEQIEYGELNRRATDDGREPSPLPDIISPTPAQIALLRIGRRAVPQLVSEYIGFFDVTDVSKWPHRQGIVKLNLTTWQPFPKQSPEGRLLMLIATMSNDEEMAIPTIAYARRLVGHYPPRSRESQACTDLIQEIQSRESTWRRSILSD